MINDNDMIHILSYDDKTITLVGTAHISKESVELVKTIIEEEKPDTVCVELCQSRYQSIRQKDKWQNMDIIKVIKEKKAFLLLLNLLLSSFQKRIAKKFDIKAGQEMLVAIESAEKNGSNIHLADRDIRITLSKTWRIMSLWNKFKLLFQFLLSIVEVDEISEADIEKMKQKDVIETILADVSKTLPELKTVLIDERDLYLAQKIRTAPGKNIVAVVGAGHLPGILNQWNAEINIEELEKIPPKSKISGIFKWFIPITISVLIAIGLFHGGFRVGFNMAKWWILIHCILAGFGAVLAFAHPLTILSAIIFAPISSINPMIKVGWVAGLVEASSRKPKVKDFENLSEDILSFKGFWMNNITRILLVVVFTNISLRIGTIISIPLIIKAF